MALYQFLCSVAVVIILSANGCYSSPYGCGKLMKGEHPRVWPWQAVIGRGRDDVCLGFIISDEWVVTSINCGYGPEHGTIVTPVGGLNNQTNNQTSFENNNRTNSQTSFENNNRTNSQTPLFVEEVRCRNNTLDGSRMGDGICLLKMSERLEFTDFVYPVCLPSEDSVLHSKMETYILAGAPHPVTKKVPLVGRRECRCTNPHLPQGMICSRRRAYMNQDMMNGDMMNGDMNQDMMNGDMMNGDMMNQDMMNRDMNQGMMEEEDMMNECQPGNGGMMLSLQDETWTLTGVSTRDQSCETSEVPQVFTSMSMLQEWIMEVTGRSRQSFKTLSSDEFDPDSTFECPHPPECPYPSPEDCRDDSLFGGANMTPASPFVILCVLALSLCFTKW